MDETDISKLSAAQFDFGSDEAFGGAGGEV